VAGELLAELFRDLIQTFDMPFGLFEVFFESRLEIGIRRGFRHLGQCFHQWIFGAVEVLEFVMEEIFQSAEFHCG
jgi:hypothetical protein